MIQEDKKNDDLKIDYGWLFLDLGLVIFQNLLALRIVFKFLGADTQNPLVSSFYVLTDPLVRAALVNLPFLNPTAEQSTFEGSTVIVFFIVYFLHQFIWRKKELKKGVIADG